MRWDRATAVAGRSGFLRAELVFEKSLAAFEGRFGFFKKGSRAKITILEVWYDIWSSIEPFFEEKV